MSTTALPDQVRWFQGRLWHQQRDLVRRRSGRPQLRVQTWVYRGDGDGFAEWPAFYSYESRPVPSVAGLTDAQLFDLFCDLRFGDDHPVIKAVEGERNRRWLTEVAASRLAEITARQPE